MIRPHPDHHAEARSASPDCGLDSMVPGQLAAISGVEGPAALRRRLMEIGFVPGSAVRFIMPTPFGDPLVFSLRGASIALRRNEARCVRIQA